MARGEIPRHNNGLIDFAALDRFYPDNSLEVPFGIFGDTSWKNHHAYYLYKEWNKPHILPDARTIREQRRIDFRGARYNRLMLHILDEEQLHKTYPTVDPEGISLETAEASLRDFNLVDELRIGVAGLAISSGSEVFGTSNFAPDLRAEISRHEQIDFFTAKRNEALASLETPEITPVDVLTSLIARIAYQMQDPFLAEVARERSEAPEIVYPFDLPHRQNAADGASNILRDAFDLEVEVVRVIEDVQRTKHQWTRRPLPSTALA